MPSTYVTEDEDRGELNVEAVLQATREFSVIDSQKAALTARQEELKGQLRAVTELEGLPDAKGNLLFTLPQQCGDILSLQLQRRVSRPLDGDVAERILTAHELWEECLEYVPVLDEQKVMALHFDGKITEAEVDEMYPENVSFAFAPIRIPKPKKKSRR